MGFTCKILEFQHFHKNLKSMCSRVVTIYCWQGNTQKPLLTYQSNASGVKLKLENV